MYPIATIIMNCMGHLHVWPGVVWPSGPPANPTNAGQESILYFQTEDDVNNVLEYLTKTERDELGGGWHIHTTNFPDEYFGLERGEK